MPAVDDSQLGLRERKKRRTRRALAEAALRLFDEKGYDATTVADIATAADVSRRTFFGYFASKEDVVFADTDERLELMRSAWSTLPEGTPPVDAVRRVIAGVFSSGAGVLGFDRGVRLRLTLDRPELRAKGLERLFTAQREFASWLRRAYPDRFDEVQAMGVSSALIGALAGAAVASFERGDPLERTRAELEKVVDLIEQGLGGVR
ncbi:MAG: TetR family transcriptional regulator [Streptosporangiales bacterium]|nr:TetR family transcriptional regulator [Streptosporangiales bacterium]